MDKSVYKKLKDVARKNIVIPYSQLAIDCHLKLNMEEIADRMVLSRMLGEISEFEVENGRPPLSVVVVLKNSHPISPADGFYTFMDELELRKKGETNDALFARLLGECFEYWKTK